MNSTPSKLSLNSLKAARKIKGFHTARNIHKEASNFFLSQKTNIYNNKKSSFINYKAFAIKKFPVPKGSPSSVNYPRMVALFNDVLPSDAALSYNRTRSENKILSSTFKTPSHRVLFPVAPEKIEDEYKTIIKSTQKIFLAKPKNETDSQKAYTTLVAQYLKEFQNDRRRPPKIDYPQLVNVVNWKINQLNDPKARQETIKKRIRGKTDTVKWKLEEAIKRAENNYLMWAKDKHNTESLGINTVREPVILEHKEEKKYVPPLKTNQILLKFQQKVKRCLETIKYSYNMSIKHWLHNAAIPMKPFSKRLSKEFFYGKHNTRKIQALLNEDSSLVYEVNGVLSF